MWQAQLQARAFADDAESPSYIRILKHHDIPMMAIVDMCEIQRNFMQKLSDDSRRIYAASSTCVPLIGERKIPVPPSAKCDTGRVLKSQLHLHYGRR